MDTLATPYNGRKVVAAVDCTRMYDREIAKVMLRARSFRRPGRSCAGTSTYTNPYINVTTALPSMNHPSLPLLLPSQELWW